MKPHQRAVQRIVMFGLAFGLVAGITAWFLYDLPAGISVIVGAGTGVVNLAAIGWLVPTLLDPDAPKSARNRAAILLAVKFIGLATLVGILIMNQWVRGIAFAAGFSMLPLAIVANALTDDSSEGRNGPDQSDPPSETPSDSTAGAGPRDP